MTSGRKRAVDPVSAAVLAWVVPGAGHLVLGRRLKALLFFVLIVGTLISGWVIGECGNIFFERGRYHVLPQMGAGVITFALGVGRAPAEPKATVMHFFEIGTLYTMVAGLLNVLVVMDAVVTSIRLRRKTP